MKLYAVRDGMPSLATKLAFKLLNIPHELVEIDYAKGDHMTEEFSKINPQKEIPAINDDGFTLSESTAIMQYLCDQYKPNSDAYPKDPKMRALVNHRLCFNISTYYRYICDYSMDPIYYDYERTPLKLKKLHLALNVFETYLKGIGKKYAVSDNITIADLPLVTSTLCLEAIDFDFSQYAFITKWYENFKKENPELWSIAESELNDLKYLEKNRPDLSNLKHPFHPMRMFTK